MLPVHHVHDRIHSTVLHVTSPLCQRQHPFYYMLPVRPVHVRIHSITCYLSTLSTTASILLHVTCPPCPQQHPFYYMLPVHPVHDGIHSHFQDRHPVFQIVSHPTILILWGHPVFRTFLTLKYFKVYSDI
jgi:hypothetical protein